MPTSSASAVWKGGLKDGTGEFSAGSGAFAGAYSFPTRFEGTPGTNPEELIASAHAACLSMALQALPFPFVIPPWLSASQSSLLPP